ncbi:Tripartite tricarboxylate transporter family receptor [compost metagenome]
MPTIAESGVPGYEANNWNGIVVPSGTPGAIVNLLQKAIADVLREPVIAERMAKSALDPIGDTPAEFARYLRAEAQKWGKLVKSAGIKAE